MNNKQIIKIVLFTCLLALGVFLVSGVLKKKDGISRHTSFYEENTPVDALVFGSSHAECGYSPMEMYKEYGITSYDMANSGERIPLSYYMIKDSVLRRHPKAVILDLYMIDEEFVYDREWEESQTLTWLALDSMRLSKTKLEATYNLFKNKSLEERCELFFYLPRYHTRWKELEEFDFDTEPRLDKGAVSYENNSMLRITDISYEKDYGNVSGRKPNEENISYIEKIKAFCDANGVDLILAYFPYQMDESHEEVSVWMKDYCNNNNISFIDLNEYDFDYTTDFFDIGHTNVIGQKKATEYIGDYLKNKDYYEDRRNDPSCETWQQDVKNFDTFKDNEISKREDLDSRFLELR